MATNGMTINGLNPLSALTADDKIPVWDTGASVEPTKEITAQNMANSVKTLGSLVNTTEMNAAIEQSTANLQGLTVYNMARLDGDGETSKPWLVIKRLIGSMPTGNLVGTISAGVAYCYYGYKFNNNYASFIVDGYSKTYGPWKVVANNGSWSYGVINVGAYTDF